MVKAQTPTIAKIKNSASETDARALVSLAICEVCDFFNVGKNMSDTQIALTADLIIESYWYLKIEEIKYCFRRAMRTEKLFDRLDGNIILGWLAAYDSERTEAAIELSENDSAKQLQPTASDGGALSFDEYIAQLRKSDANDAAAQQTLAEAEKLQSMMKSSREVKSQREKDMEYKQWYYSQYLKNGKNAKR